MVSSIGSNMNSAAMMNNNTMMRPPEGKNAFTASDTDGNGSVSASELEVLAKGIEEVTGTAINVEDALSNFDADGDSGLSGEELLEMLSSMGFSPPAMQGGGQEEQRGGPPPPPPPSTEEAMSAYSQNSGDDLMTQLMEALEGSSEDDESVSQTSISLTS